MNDNQSNIESQDTDIIKKLSTRRFSGDYHTVSIDGGFNKQRTLKSSKGTRNSRGFENGKLPSPNIFFRKKDDNSSGEQTENYETEIKPEDLREFKRVRRNSKEFSSYLREREHNRDIRRMYNDSKSDLSYLKENSSPKFKDNSINSEIQTSNNNLIENIDAKSNLLPLTNQDNQEMEIEESRDSSYILPYDNIMHHFQYFYLFRDDKFSKLNESSNSIDLNSYHLTLENDEVKKIVQKFKKNIVPKVPLYRNINKYSMHAVAPNQKEFLIDYYYYLKLSGPSPQGQNYFYMDENSFPPTQTVPLINMKNQILDDEIKINETHNNGIENQYQPMKNSHDDETNQQLLLAFLEERVKRDETGNDFTSQNGLNQTFTFLKDYYAPNEEVLKKKSRENVDNDSKKDVTKKDDKKDLKNQENKLNDSKNKKDIVEKRPKTSESTRIMKLSLNQSRRVDRASTAGRKVRQIIRSESVAQEKFESTSDQDKDTSFTPIKRERRRTVSISIIESSTKNKNEYLDGENTTKEIEFESNESDSNSDSSTKVPRFISSKLIELQKIERENLLPIQNMALDSDEESTSDTSHSSDSRSRIPLTEADFSILGDKSQVQSKLKKKLEKKLVSKSTKKTTEVSQKNKSKKKTDKLENIEKQDKIDKVEKEKNDKNEKKNKKSKKRGAVLISPDKNSKPNTISLAIENIILPSKLKLETSTNENEAIAELEKQAKLDDLLYKVDRLIEEITLQKSSNKKALIDLLQVIENRQNQSKLVNCEKLLAFIKDKLTSFDNVMQLFASRCLLKLSFARVNREHLFEYGFLPILISILGESINISNEDGYNNSKSKSDNKIIRELLKTIHLFCKLGESCIEIVENSLLIECIIKLIGQEELKSQKIALRCLCSIIQAKRDNNSSTILNKICRLGAIDSLFSMLKNANSTNQKDSLEILCYLTENEASREEIYNKGVFHSFLWLMRSESEEIQELAVTALSHYIPSEILHVDALILKYGLDFLIQFFVESFNKNIVQATTKILAHVSEYSRIHIALIQPNVLKQAFNLLFEDNAMTLKSTMFGTHVILSNLSKYKEGQREIYKLGGLNHILKSLEQIALHFQSKIVPSLNKEDDMAQSERLLLPKVITRTIANLSGSLECHSRIINENTLERLIDLIDSTGERTVVWNILCCISNLCDQPHNQRKLLSKKCITDCLYNYLNQREDEKLLSRSIRCIAILSKNVHIQEDLERFFPLQMIVPICKDIVHSEIQLDALRYIANLSHNYDFHETIIENDALGVIVKLSYFPLPVFHLEVARCLYNLSQNTNCRSALIEEGAITSLMRLKSESKHEKVRRYCETALKKF